MHESVHAWVAGVVGIARLRDASVLEVGSLDINGSVRDLFGGPYVGVDATPGPSVDRVMDAHRLAFPDGTFDAVICCEMVEHDAAFWLTLAEIGRVLRPDGALILTTRGNGFPEHRYPYDYWRFMPDAAGLLARLAGCEPVSVTDDPQDPGVFVFARKVA